MRRLSVTALAAAALLALSACSQFGSPEAAISASTSATAAPPPGSTIYKKTEQAGATGEVTRTVYADPPRTTHIIRDTTRTRTATRTTVQTTTLAPRTTTRTQVQTQTQHQTHTQTTTAPAPSGEIVLGYIPSETSSTGYGTVRPSFLSISGMCANSVADVSWSSWGGSTASGSGVPCVSAGEGMDGVEPTSEPLIASNPGDCNGVCAYRTLQIGGGPAESICY